MRLVQLAAKLITRRGGDSQAVAASKMLGSSPSGTGSRTAAIAELEASSANRAATGMMRHPTLGELKRFAKKEGANTKGLAYDVLGRD